MVTNEAGSSAAASSLLERVLPVPAVPQRDAVCSKNTNQQTPRGRLTRLRKGKYNPVT